MSLLVIDVENRCIRFGLFSGPDLTRRWVLTASPRSADEMTWAVEGLLGTEMVERVVMCSVVPSLTSPVRQMAQRLADHVLVVGPGVKSGLSMGVDNPRDLGADRVVGAVAAVEAVGCPVVVVDFRTATTIDVVDADKVFRGGVIAPGLEVSADSLALAAAGLRHVEIVTPPRVVGRNTTEAIQAGIVLGAGAMVEGLIGRIETEMGLPGVKVIATGDHAATVAAVTRRIDLVEENLTMLGLRLIADHNPI